MPMLPLFRNGRNECASKLPLYCRQVMISQRHLSSPRNQLERLSPIHQQSLQGVRQSQRILVVYNCCPSFLSRVACNARLWVRVDNDRSAAEHEKVRL